MGMTISNVSYRITLDDEVILKPREEGTKPLVVIPPGKTSPVHVDNVIEQTSTLVKTAMGWLHEADPNLPR